MNAKEWFSVALAIILLITSIGYNQVPKFDGNRAYRYLVAQCDFGPRNPGSVGHAECKDWISTELKKYSTETYIQSFSAIESLTGNSVKLYNIIAHFGDSDKLGLMLCAHWDTRAFADQDEDVKSQKTPVMGANDGASGVAVILEICRIIADNPPPRPIIVVFFDGEDMGRASNPAEFAIGSKYWANHPIPYLPEEAILLDMVGDVDLELPIELYSNANAPILTRKLWDIAEILELEAFKNYYGIPVTDDHVNLQRVGVRAVDIIDFEYPYWHTTEDTPDKCSAESLSQVGKLLIGYIYGTE